MRTMILGLLALLGVLVITPTTADAQGRLEWQCHHGNYHACHMLRHRHYHSWHHHHHYD
jgi:hypothetical protein